MMVETHLRPNVTSQEVTGVKRVIPPPPSKKNDPYITSSDMTEMGEITEILSCLDQ